MLIFIVLNNSAYVRQIHLAEFQFVLCTMRFIKSLLASIKLCPYSYLMIYARILFQKNWF